MVVIGLGKNLLFKSILARCAISCKKTLNLECIDLCVAYAHNKALSSLDGFRLSKPNTQSTNTIQREPTISDYMGKEFGECLLNVTKRKNKPHQVCT